MANKPNIVKAIGNKLATTLSGSITDSDTTITVADGSGFSTTGGYIMIDEAVTGKREIIYVESVSSNTLTVATNGRGKGDTTAVAHDSGAVVTDVIVDDHINGIATKFRVEHGDDGTHDVTASPFNTIIPTGTITQYAASSAPTGWLLCDGSAVSRSTYATLFGVIGEDYGAGDGSTTFNVPNLQGKVAVGYESGDADFGTLADTGGAKTVTLTSAQSGLPAHNHTQNAHNHTQDAHSHDIYAPSSNLAAGGSSVGNELVGSGKDTGNDTRPATATNRAATATNNANTAANASEAHTNLQPFIVLNYIIKN